MVTVLEAGPGLADPGLRSDDCIGCNRRSGSPLVERYRTRLTDRPVRHRLIVRGATVGGSAQSTAVISAADCPAISPCLDTGWAWSDVLEHFRAISRQI